MSYIVIVGLIGRPVQCGRAGAMWDIEKVLNLRMTGECRRVTDRREECLEARDGRRTDVERKPD